MENTASNNSNNSSSNRSIADPFLNMYRESIDAWQKGYNGPNDFAQTSRPQQGQTNAAFNPNLIPPPKPPAAPAPGQLKSSPKSRFTTSAMFRRPASSRSTIALSAPFCGP